jgi:dienelactone hydrolase
MKIHDVIFVPGLGDERLQAQRWLISSWRLWGVRPHMVQMNWAKGQDFEPKLQKLFAKIDELYAKGHKVSLVGASAGAGAVLNAFAARKEKVTGVVCICGKVNNPEGIGEGYRQRTPAFIGSAYRVQTSLDQLGFKTDRVRIQSRYAVADGVIRMADSKVIGGHNKTMPTIGHAFTIATQLLFGAPFFIRFLKKTSK